MKLPKLKSQLILLAIFLHCSVYNPYQSRDDNREKKAKDLTIVASILNGCQYGSSNSLFAGSYYQRYSQDKTQYNKLVLGDSTMDIACNSFTNYVSSGTGCFPVSGNKLPDFEKQLCVLNTTNPSLILTSTSGGNDLLGQIGDAEIIQRGKSYIDALDSKFPSATKVLIQVHPTRVTYANQHRNSTNSGIASYAQSKGWKVENPDSCFTVDSDGNALQSNLLDSIHPDSPRAFCIKNKILSDFGLTY